MHIPGARRTQRINARPGNRSHRPVLAALPLPAAPSPDGETITVASMVAAQGEAVRLAATYSSHRPTNSPHRRTHVGAADCQAVRLAATYSSHRPTNSPHRRTHVGAAGCEARPLAAAHLSHPPTCNMRAFSSETLRFNAATCGQGMFQVSADALFAAESYRLSHGNRAD